jgi:hypothetical protein
MKGGLALEALARTRTVIFDKIGRKESSCWRLRRRSSAAASQARTRSRTAS